MNQMVAPILEKLIYGRSLSVVELKELKEAFKDNSLRKEIDEWLENNWDQAPFTDIEINYDNLKQMVWEYESHKQSGNKVVSRLVYLARYYQRVAAALFIPLILGISLYLYYSQNVKENFYVAEAPLGQKAKIEMPDGSVIWLNSGSKIKYSSEFNKNGRSVELKGEAFFDVKKNTQMPFYVNTPVLDIKVTGTRFNVNAYNDEPVVETALVEGKVNVMLKNEKRSVQLTPGNMLTYSKTSHEVAMSTLNEEVSTAWKDNRLVFINDDFYKLAKKIEKWYNVKVVYDTIGFRNNKLTVKLVQGEQLNRLLNIIETAINAKCTVKENKIYITKN